MNIILPLCGIGNRFIEAGFSDPNPLIDVSFTGRFIQKFLYFIDSM
jgi:hypothetical protein